VYLSREDNSKQIDLQERIKNANETYFMLQKFKKKHIKQTKIKTKVNNKR
jgi:hypothetical protein